MKAKVLLILDFFPKIKEGDIYHDLQPWSQKKYRNNEDFCCSIPIKVYNTVSGHNQTARSN